MEDISNLDIYPLYIDAQYCFDYNDFVGVISSIIERAKSISDVDKQSNIEIKILLCLEPLIFDKILVQWLRRQSTKDASELADTIKEALDGGKEPIKVVRHILLALGFL